MVGSPGRKSQCEATGPLEAHRESTSGGRCSGGLAKKMDGSHEAPYVSNGRLPLNECIGIDDTMQRESQ